MRKTSYDIHPLILNRWSSRVMSGEMTDEERRHHQDVHRAAHQVRHRRILAMGYDDHRLIGSLWDMDHIHPVDEGGGGCGLDNLQTLCQPCHKAKTRRQAGDRTIATRRAADVASGQGGLPGVGS